MRSSAMRRRAPIEAEARHVVVAGGVMRGEAVAILPDLPLTAVGGPALTLAATLLLDCPSSHPALVPVRIFARFRLTKRGGGGGILW